jgi:hypothetical protein
MLPKEVQKIVDRLNDYQEVDALPEINLIHMYPLEIAYPLGYYDSKFFQAIGYCFESGKKCDLGRHDELKFEDDVVIDIARIYADGSTLLRFKTPVAVDSALYHGNLYLKRKGA